MTFVLSLPYIMVLFLTSVFVARLVVLSIQRRRNSEPDNTIVEDSLQSLNQGPTRSKVKRKAFLRGSLNPSKTTSSTKDSTQRADKGRRITRILDKVQGVSCWSTCEHNVLFRLFELFRGNETSRNLRLVNRHWCKVISESLDEISPSPFRFHVMDMRLLKLHFSGVRKLGLLDHDLLCDLWFERIGLLQQLEVLSVRFSVPKKEAKVTNEGLNSILKMKSLTHLELSGCQFLTPSGIRVLSKKQNLRFLDLSRSKISNRFMLPIISLKNLNHLDLSENPAISGIGIQVLTTLENLKSLCLKNCSNLSEQDLTEIANFTKLRTLDLRMCKHITGSAFQFFPNTSKLRILDLSNCASLSDSSLSYIAKIRHLKTLVLQYCQSITDKGLAFLCEHDSLTCLRIGGSDFITDEGLRNLSQNSSLESISLLFLNNISTFGIQAIISIVNLRYLSIIECRNVGNIKDSGLLLKHNRRALELDQYPTHFE